MTFNFLAQILALAVVRSTLAQSLCTGSACVDGPSVSLLEHKASKLPSKERVDKICAGLTTGKYHYPNMQNIRIQVTRWEHCQSYCRVTVGCKFFSFWPDGGCQLQSGPGEFRTASSAYSAVISGPAHCEGQSTPKGVINLLDMSTQYCLTHPADSCCSCGVCCNAYCSKHQWTLRDGCGYKVDGFCEVEAAMPVCAASK
mmetsp:Transcript_38596/g.86286  ORF Transcript_38596/g.86286 Transcript_38596/m.86286 type:complete len:200 (+) Transcript_38596:74-673(+)